MLWLARIQKLASISAIPIAKDVKKYRFVYRITLEDRDTLKLRDENLQAFQPLEPRLAARLGVATPAYSIFVDDKYTPYNYGGVLNRL